MSKVIDVFPQVFRVKAEQPSANGFVEVQIPTGLAALRALQFRANKRTVVELLKIFYVIPNPEDATSDLDRQFWTLATVSEASSPRNMSERGCIYQFDTVMKGSAGSAVFRRDGQIDLTGGGIGRLIATDNLYLQFDSESMIATGTMYMQILFRYVNISLQEYSDIKEGQVTYE
ncbi:hypothetical protein KAW18_18220 [candidate division WOR-3 bacterium]|nr:hypothetical protein [candidate division WOR-3 bacterium]